MTEKYIIIAITGIIQSWGAPSTLNPNSGSPRNSYGVPTLSGLTGCINSALGIKRGEESPVDPNKLKIVIREDVTPTFNRDYQIAQNHHHGFRAPESATKEIPKIFLEEGSYLVAMGYNHKNGEHVINMIEEALNNPHYAPYYGRRAHVPLIHSLLGSIKTDNPVKWIKEAPLITTKINQNNIRKIYSNIPISDSRTINQKDVPTSTNPKTRKFKERSIYITQTHKTPETNYEEKYGILAGVEKIKNLIGETVNVYQ